MTDATRRVARTRETMKQCHTKGRENSRDLCVLPPLLGERARVRASVSSNLILGVVREGEGSQLI